MKTKSKKKVKTVKTVKAIKVYSTLGMPKGNIKVKIKK